MPLPMPTSPSGVEETQWTYAIGHIRGYCRWHIAPTHTEAITGDGPGGDLLALPTQHLTDVASITNDGTAVTDPEWSQSGLVRTGWRWSSKMRGVVATITHGYELWPEELEALALDIISMSSRGGAKQISSGTHQVSFEASLTSSQRATLDRYRLVDLP